MNDTPAAGSPWPPPHPVIDAAYGPRWQPPPEPPAPGWVRGPIEPRPQSKKWVAIFVTVTLLVAGAGGLAVAAFIARQGPTRPVDSSGWDTRVAPLARFVEQKMGTTFTDHVPVEFLEDADFEDLVTQPESSLSRDEREQYDVDEAIGRAFGWYAADMSLFEASNELNAAGILAYYSYDQQLIVARTPDPGATTLDVELRVTIVHELVHAMQDQRLGGIDAIRGQGTAAQETEAITALIEGHAVFVEDAYIASFTEAERDDFYTRTAARGDAIAERVGEVPVMLSIPGAASYSAGPVLVAAADLSPNGIAGLYDDPPTAMDQVLDPRKYFAADRTETVAPPAPPTMSGSVVTFDQRALGPVRLYGTLVSAFDPQEAWEIASGWGGDRYIAYRTPESEGGDICVRWIVIGDDTATTTRIGEALDTWAEQRVDRARVEVVHGPEPGDQVAVNLCDPGTSTEQALAPPASADYFYARANELWDLVDETSDLTVAGCAWDVLFQEFPVEALNANGADVRTRTTEAITACR